MLKKSKEAAKWLYRFIASKELIVVLFIALCFFLAVTTLLEDNDVIWHLIRILLVLSVFSLILCTLQRIKTLSVPVLIIHIGVILAFIGGGVSSFGFVATVNIYEGTYVDKVFRWDIEKDVSLGFDIFIEKLHEEYYPVPVKVGVMKGAEKFDLVITRTGDTFELGGFDIRVDSLERYKKILYLSAFKEGEYLGGASTSGMSDLPADFPFDFKLVAFMDPVIKSNWVDIKLIRNSEVIAEGRTEVNSPLKWEGLNFYHTATNVDPQGKPFVGLQITRDPGTALVYTGFGIISIGAVFYIFRMMRRRR